jgi:hypothetical protein
MKLLLDDKLEGRSPPTAFIVFARHTKQAKRLELVTRHLKFSVPPWRSLRLGGEVD